MRNHMKSILLAFLLICPGSLFGENNQPINLNYTLLDKAILELKIVDVIRVWYGDFFRVQGKFDNSTMDSLFLFEENQSVDKADTTSLTMSQKKRVFYKERLIDNSWVRVAQPTVVSKIDINEIWVKKKSRGTGAAFGAVIFGTVGTVFGFALKSLSDGIGGKVSNTAPIFGGLSGAIVGGMIGAGFGSGAPNWKQVYKEE